MIEILTAFMVVVALYLLLTRGRLSSKADKLVKSLSRVDIELRALRREVRILDGQLNPVKPRVNTTLYSQRVKSSNYTSARGGDVRHA